MDRPLNPTRVTRFHAVRCARAALLCLALFWLASQVTSQAAAIAGAGQAMLFVSVQPCPETNSGRPARTARALAMSLACALLVKHA